MRYRSLVGLGLLLLGGMKAGAADAPKSFSAPVGLQLYSLRAQFTKSSGMGTEWAAKPGFRDVETDGTYGLEPGKFRELLNAVKQIRW